MSAQQNEKLMNFVLLTLGVKAGKTSTQLTHIADRVT